MRPIRVLALIACSGTHFWAHAAVIDQVAIAVGKQAITESDITREINLTALLNHDKAIYSVEFRRAAADRLIEQALVRREMEFGSYSSAPPQQGQSAYESIAKEHGGEEAFWRELARDGLTKQDLLDYLGWQISLLKFIDLRFRPAVQVSRADIQKYYETNYQARDGAGVPALRDVRAKIEEKLTAERVDHQLDLWIKDQRAHTIIRYLDSTLGTTKIPKPGSQIEMHAH
jgi:hypothetical protein